MKNLCLAVVTGLLLLLPSAVVQAQTPLTITTTNLPDATCGMAYTVLLQATGGTAPYSWALAAGSTLPAVFKLNPRIGGLMGKPTTAGTYNFTVEVTDATMQTATLLLSLTVTGDCSGGGTGTTTGTGTVGGGGVPMALTITATATVQGSAKDNGTLNKVTTSTMKITTQSIIQQIYFAAGAGTPPKGAKLVLNSDGSASVTDSKGNVLQDASSAVQISLDPNGAGVWSGSSNDNTSQTSYTGVYITSITFITDQNGNTATISGLTKETYSLTATVAGGNQIGSDSISMTGAGEGSVLDSQGNTDNVIVTGTVIASGKGIAGQ